MPTLNINNDQVNFPLANVGIGTTSPRAGEATPLTLQSSDGYVGITLNGTGSYENVWQLYASGNGAGLDFLGMYDRTAGAYRLVATNTGNVLIGTTTDAGYKLDVNGIAMIRGTLEVAGEAGITLYWSGSTINDSRIGRIRPISTPSQNPYAGGLAFDYYKYDGSAYNFFEGMRLNGAGKLGIGTATPGLKVDIVGGDTLTGTASGIFRAVQDQTNYRGVVLGYDTSGQIGIIYPETPAAASTLAIWTYTGSAWGERMRVASDGNVLIGTTTDSGYKLDVSGNARVTDTLFVNTTVNKGKFNIIGYDNGGINIIDQRTSSASGALYYSSITFRDFYDSVASASINFYHNQYFGAGVNRFGFQFEGGERMSILYNGNVGIGTTSPTNKLEVDGGSSAVTLRVSTTNTSNGSSALILSNSSKTAFNDGVKIAHGGGFTNITDLNGTNIMAWDMSNTRVGIGTTSPARKLTISTGTPSGATTAASNTAVLIDSAANQYLEFRTAAASDGYMQGLLFTDNGCNAFIGFKEYTGAVAGTYGESVHFSISDYSGSDAGSGFYFGTSSNNENGVTSPLVFLRSNGNMMIGTTTDAGFKLDVNGTGRFNGQLQTTQGGRTLFLGDGAFANHINVDSNVDFAFNYNNGNIGGFGFFAGGTVAKFFISNSGDVTARKMWLSTNGATDATTAILANASTNDSTSYAAIFGSLNAGYRMVVRADGNVGIGTTSPGAKLEVTDEIRVSSGGSYASFTARNTGTTGGGGLLGYQNGVANAFFGVAGWYLGNSDTGIIVGTDSSSRPIRFYTNFEQMRIAGNGNVLIGTTTDSGIKLDVNGNGRFSGGTVYLGDYTGNAQLTFQAAQNSWSKINFYDNNDSEGLYIRTDGESRGGTMTFGARWDDDEPKVVFKMYQSSAGAAYDVRVGVNTSSPASIMHLAGGDGQLIIQKNNYVAIHQEQAWATNLLLGAYYNGTNQVYGASGRGAFKILTLHDSDVDPQYIAFYGANAGTAGNTITWNTVGFAQDEDGNVGIGTTAPSAKFHVNGDATDNVGLALFNNTKDGGGVFFPAAKFTNVRGNHSYGIVADFSIGTSGDGDRPTVLFYGAQASASWQVGQVTSSWGSNDSFGIGYRANNDPNSFNAWPTNYFNITTGGNVLIGTTTDGGYKLRVNGEIRADDDIRISNTYALVINADDNNWRIGRNTISDSGWLTGNTMQMVVFGGETGQGYQVVNSNGTALFEIDGVAGASRFSNALGVGVNPSGTAGRIDASNDIVAYSTSDRRLKENITPIANALDRVKALTGVEFDWKEETKHVHGYEGHDSGVIAQEVKEVMPTAIRENESGYLSVRYEKLIGLLIEANKELANRVEELEKKLK